MAVFTPVTDAEIALWLDQYDVGTVRAFRGISTDGTLTVQLTAGQGKTLISGIELVRDGLPLEPLTSDASDDR